ncbi:MAG TPA: DUF1580 domain-containing protein [Gemmataceae bacterium]
MSATPPDLTRETMLSLAQAARRFPPSRLGRPVSPATIWRWCRRGVRVPGNGVVYLECVRLSGRWLTSVEAISRFVARQTPLIAESPGEAPRSAGQRSRMSERAAAELDRLGL